MKQREDGTEYRLSRQEGEMETWHALNYQMVDV